MFEARVWTIDPAFKEQAFASLAQARAQAAQAGKAGFAGVALLLLIGVALYKKYQSTTAPTQPKADEKVKKKEVELDPVLKNYAIKDYAKLPKYTGKWVLNSLDVVTEPVMQYEDQLTGTSYLLIKVFKGYGKNDEGVIALSKSSTDASWKEALGQGMGIKVR